MTRRKPITTEQADTAAAVATDDAPTTDAPTTDDSSDTPTTTTRTKRERPPVDVATKQYADDFDSAVDVTAADVTGTVPLAALDALAMAKRDLPGGNAGVAIQTATTNAAQSAALDAGDLDRVRAVMAVTTALATYAATRTGDTGATADPVDNAVRSLVALSHYSAAVLAALDTDDQRILARDTAAMITAGTLPNADGDGFDPARIVRRIVAGGGKLNASRGNGGPQRNVDRLIAAVASDLDAGTYTLGQVMHACVAHEADAGDTYAPLSSGALSNALNRADHAGDGPWSVNDRASDAVNERGVPTGQVRSVTLNAS